MTVNSTTTSITDSMMELANGNTASDLLDIGFYGNYDDGLSEVVHQSILDFLEMHQTQHGSYLMD